MKRILLLLLLTPFLGYVKAQYTLNGSATANNCHCYTLTPDVNAQSGSVWNNFKINLSQSFDFNFDINLGCADEGADGLVFVLQPISTSVGSSGGGLGYAGITPSAGITIDTWQNTDINDPAYDHIAIQLNGNLDHASNAANIAGPVTAIAGNDNIEDCQWHTFRIQWDAITKTLTAYIDGQLRVTASTDLVADVFLGNPEVFWGFTGSTGGFKNLQQFCTALSPKFTFVPVQKRCINEPINFIDSTISFTPVQKLYWDFGDGTPVDSINRNPVHSYPIAGDYTVTQTVVGADGCVETNLVPLRIGSIPTADFATANGCLNTNLQFADASTVTTGTINQWQWNLDAAGTAAIANPIAVFPTTGPQTISLQVTTLEGCESAVTAKTMEVYPAPVADFSISGSRCQKTVVQFTDLSNISAGSITSVNYNFGNGQQSAMPNTSMIYYSAKAYTVVQTVTSNQNCSSSKTVTIQVLPMPVASFRYVVNGCTPRVVTFADSSYTSSGEAISGWSWNFGNGITSLLQNPLTTYTVGGNPVVQLQVANVLGCTSEPLQQPLLLPDRPVAAFGFSTPLCEGVVQLLDSSTNATGSIQTWQWSLDNVVVSAEKDPSINLSAGLHTIQLIVTNEVNCSSIPATRQITVSPAPVISMGFNDACRDSLVQFRANQLPGDPVQQWQWDFGDNTTGFSADTQHSYNKAGTFPVKLTAISIAGCSTTIDSNINVYATNANAGPDTVLASVNQPIQLSATGGTLYQWSPSAGISNDTIYNPVAVNTSSQLYQLKAYSSAGCASFDTILIRVLDGPQLYVPTAFSPNGDTKNDLLRIWAPGITRLKQFTVFNRYGQTVFSTNDAARGWDGNVKGKAQPVGVYVWIASGTSFRGNEIVQKGTVVLIR